MRSTRMIFLSLAAVSSMGLVQYWYTLADEHGHSHPSKKAIPNAKAKAREAKGSTPEIEEDHAHDEPAGEHSDEHGHEEEESSSSVGPDKGILAASEQNGFQLSPEALKSFAIRSDKIKTPGAFSIPRSAIVFSGDSIGVFRSREGFFKRITASFTQQTNGLVQVQSPGVRVGDEVVVQGAPFLRIAELDAAGGISHGHSH